jgi:hypothetical protein
MKEAETDLELSIRSSDGDGGVVTHDLSGDHGEGLALSRVDLSGHDGRSGLVLGEGELAETASGSRGKVSDVVRDLHEGDGDGVEGTGGFDDSVVGGEGLELSMTKERWRRGSVYVREWQPEMKGGKTQTGEEIGREERKEKKEMESVGRGK